MKVKTSELTGAALDWAVAKCEDRLKHIRLNKFKQWEDLLLTQVRDDDYIYWNPSEDWAQGGPIIEREELSVEPLYTSGGLDCWQAYGHNLRYDTQGNYIQGSDNRKYGPTPLIAAMRCFVASKLGNEVEIPEDLK